jgi:Concanavalin A-like lectin/glucanases superfamily/Type I phosphodiesterase / nucleotide pyrophosphatase
MRQRTSRSWLGTFATMALLIGTAAISGCGANGHPSTNPAGQVSPPATGGNAAATGASAPATGGSAPATGGAPNGPVASTPTRKVLIVGVSGVQYTVLSQAIAQQQTPNFAHMAIVPALAGGVPGTTTQQPTLSAPGWASVLTGSWANRHGIRSDYAAQSIGTDTLFELAKQAGAQSTAAIASWSNINTLLSPATDAGYIDASVNCAGVDSCVVNDASTAISGGSADVIFANLTGPQTVAAASGLQADYSNALAVVDKEIGQLQAAITARQAQTGVNEQWLVLVTTDQGLDATGSESGLPLLSNETAFVASNQPLTVGATTTPLGTIAASPTLAQLQAGATQADITPTVLAWFNAVPNPALYAIDGTSLVGTIGPRSLQATPGTDKASLNLSWTAPPTTPSQLLLYRDGTLIATLPGTAQSYVDNQLGKTTTGLYTFNYTLVAGNAAVSTLAQISYVQPIPLDPTLAQNLIHYFSFDSGLTDAIIPTVALQQWDPASTTTASFVPDSFGAQALQVASLNTTANAFNGMKLAPDDVSNQPQFTIGFWFYSGDGQNDSPIVTNKNWYTGLNPGFAIVEESNGTIHFNISDGTTRPTDQALTFTKNAWIYVAFVVDTTTTHTAVGYIYDPVYGLEKATLNEAGLNPAKLAGNYSTISFNEDVLGTYYSRTSQGGGTHGTMTFNDVTMWNKALTSAQIQGLYSSGKSLSTIAP